MSRFEYPILKGYNLGCSGVTDDGPVAVLPSSVLTEETDGCDGKADGCDGIDGLDGRI